jgi:hypothetical protein
MSDPDKRPTSVVAALLCYAVATVLGIVTLMVRSGGVQVSETGVLTVFWALLLGGLWTKVRAAYFIAVWASAAWVANGVVLLVRGSGVSSYGIEYAATLHVGAFVALLLPSANRHFLGARRGIEGEEDEPRR